MRLFTALEPPHRVTEALGEAVRRGRRHEPRLRWTAPEHWHLTLVFLGEVAPEDLPTLEAGIERAAAAHPPLDLALDGWGTFPPQGRRASVLWAGVGGHTRELAALVEDLRSAAGQAGVETGARPYVPHITVARSRPPRDLGATVASLGNPPQLGWRATRIALVESLPGPRTRYRTALTCPLLWGTDTGRTAEWDTS
ncbi:RNA 2',3'-cyclic phosphodiesterase [Nocardiopsis kunsanensis]|uniref:RNA 2',3'-cyclic phosphodiesterase n=1 Tax=Nocardiopsis kunsanensis TaxID=141693 RepID=A0A918XJJ6_9ACTN|nr:RNA 2',3'-cyclic phosphodiesterase [Nocardiopsis kunsanensis]GHD35088.1 RNA 2',3'-cyclic phosphodiesterase [Nocardiopsis kunsanensis]